MSRFSRAGTVTGLALVISTLQLGLVHPDLAAGAQLAGCGNVPPSMYGVKATKVKCKEARRVARAWHDRAYDESSGTVDDDVRVRGFRCRYDNGIAIIVRCRDGARMVKFEYGA